MDVATWAALIGAVILVAGAVGGGTAVGFGQRQSQTITDIQSSNDVLRSDLEAEKLRRIDQERECERQIAHLQGQVDALSRGIVQDVVRDIRMEFRTQLRPAVQEGFDHLTHQIMGEEPWDESKPDRRHE